MRTFPVILLLALIAADCGSTGAAVARDHLRPSDLNKNPQKYDQQMVVVDGILLINLPHNNHLKVIYESRIRDLWVRFKSKLGFKFYDIHPDKGCVSIDNPDMIWDNVENPRYRHVRIRGVFTAHTESPWWAVSGTCATDTGIWVEEILEAR